MNNESQVHIDDATKVGNILSWQFGIAVLAGGLVNIFWGNDMLFGIFIALLSLVYFLPVNAILMKILGFTIPRLGIVKIILGVLITWVLFGVGDLFDKLDLMRKDLIL